MLKKLVLAAAAIAFVGWATSATAQVPVANHYGCYQVKDLKVPAKFPNTGMYAVPTQVSPEVATKCKPKFLCMPSAKEGNPVIDPALHYMCYQCKGSKIKVGYQVTDQFGPIQVETKKFKLICNPSVKVPL